MAVQDTKKLQRALLKILSSNIVELRKNGHSIKEDWFETTPLKYIFKKIIDNFTVHNSAYSETLFLADLENEGELDSLQKTAYRAEWAYVAKETVQQVSSDAIIARLEQKETQSSLIKILTEAANDIETGDPEKALSELRSKLAPIGKKEKCPSSIITDLMDVEQGFMDKLTNPEKYAGIPTGFPMYDRKIGGLFPNELILFSAVTGVGKSTIMRQLAYNVIKVQKNVLFITNEESHDEQKMKVGGLICEVDVHQLKSPQFMTTETRQKWDLGRALLAQKNALGQLGKLIIHEIPHYSTVAEIEKAFMMYEMMGVKIDVIFIDYLDHLKPMAKFSDVNDEQAKIGAEAKGLALHCRVPVVTNTQAATDAEKKQEHNKKFSKFDIYGSKRKVHACNALVYLRHESNMLEQLKPAGDRETDNDCDRIVSVDIAKNRNGGYFSFTVHHHVQSGKMEQIANSASNQAGRAAQAEIDNVLSIQQQIRAHNAARGVVEGPQGIQGPQTIDVENDTIQEKEFAEFAELEAQEEAENLETTQQAMATFARNDVETVKVYEKTQGFTFKRPNGKLN